MVVVYTCLGIVCEKQEKYEEAESWYKKAAFIQEKILGKNHPDTAICYYNLADLYREERRYEEAEKVYRKVLEIDKKILGEGHKDTQEVLNSLIHIEYELKNESQGRIKP